MNVSLIFEGISHTQSEQQHTNKVCSASRSALLTGRYAWLSGLNSISGPDSNAGFNDQLVLFPKLLNDNGWNTYIAGKWYDVFLIICFWRTQEITNLSKLPQQIQIQACWILQ